MTEKPIGFKINAPKGVTGLPESQAASEPVTNGEIFEPGQRTLKADIGRLLTLGDPILESPDDDTITINRTELTNLILAVGASQGWGGADPIPTITGVSISGTPTQGETLTGSYTYSGQTEGASIKQWYRSDDNTGTNRVAISGAVNLTYVPQVGDIGKFLQLAVTPKDSDGDTGTIVYSAFTAAIAEASASDLLAGYSLADPRILDNGKPVVLTGTVYTIPAADQDYFGRDPGKLVGAGSKIALKYTALTKDLQFGAGRDSDVFRDMECFVNFDSAGAASIRGAGGAPTTAFTIQPTIGQFVVLERVTLTNGSGASTWRVGLSTNGSSYVGTPQDVTFNNYADNIDGGNKAAFGVYMKQGVGNELNTPQHKLS